MAYKIMQKGEDGKLREVKVDDKEVLGFDFSPAETELKEFDESTRSFLAIATAESPDRMEDIISIRGWELDDYMKNPVGMWAHKYDTLPIFRTLDIEIKPRQKKMYFRPGFDDHEFATRVFNSYIKKIMRGFSVGFIPYKYEMRDRDEMTEEEQMRAGFFGGRLFKKQSLLEISSAPIPMHPDALSSMKSFGLPIDDELSGAIELGFINEKTKLSNGNIWFPVRDCSEYFNISYVKISDDVTAVNGKPFGSSGSDRIVADVLGYIFPKDWDDEKINDWLKSAGLSETSLLKFVEADGDKESLNLKVEEGKFILEDIEKGICGSSSLPTNPRSSWNGPAAQKRMWAKGVSTYRKGHVWQKEGADSENKTSYSLPFADIIGGKLAAVWGGVRAAMAAVHGARNRPEGNRRAMHNFLAKYYKKFGKEVPEFRSYEEDEWKEVFGFSSYEELEKLFTEEEEPQPQVLPIPKSAYIEEEEESGKSLIIITDTGIMKLNSDFLEKFGITLTIKEESIPDEKLSIEDKIISILEKLEEIEEKVEAGKEQDDEVDKDIEDALAKLLDEEDDDDFSDADKEIIASTLKDVLKDHLNLSDKVEDAIKISIKRLSGTM